MSMSNLRACFGHKLTENGDMSFSTTSNNYLDIVFMTDYFKDRCGEIPTIGTSEWDKAFAMMVRDPRYGMGCRNVGRHLMKMAECSKEEILFAGRADDFFKMDNGKLNPDVLDFLKKEIEAGNELVKKWMPRYASKNLLLAREIAKYWGMNKQQYGHFVKCDTVEQKLSRGQLDEINFSHVPSLAFVKYAEAFRRKMTERYTKFLEDVAAGKSQIHTSTTSPYDIYKMLKSGNEDAAIFFDQLEKIQGNWIPVVDTSGSMTCTGSFDAYGKALALGHYLAKCSTYMKDYVISFSSKPKLIELGKARGSHGWDSGFTPNPEASKYANEIYSMYTGDCSNTDFGAVMHLLQGLDKENAPEFIVVFSDMEFDAGSSQSKDETMALFKANGFNTKIVWWNLNARATAPELDSEGNVFISGYNPRLLKFLEAGFDGETFVKKLVSEYQQHLATK